MHILQLLTQDSHLVIEYPVELGNMPFSIGNGSLLGLRNRRYGRTVLAIYVYRATKIYEFRPTEFENRCKRSGKNLINTKFNNISI
jgi:16S rRNA (guanine966-N2)-methyltransferase